MIWFVAILCAASGEVFGALMCCLIGAFMEVCK